METTMSDNNMKRVRVFCTVREDLEQWIKEEIEAGSFRTRSEAIEKGLFKLRESMKE